MNSSDWSVAITPSAEEDLVEIGRYTQKMWGVEQRDRYLYGITDTIETLRKIPYSSVKRDYWRPNLRSLTYQDQYYIICRLDEANQIIQILRILHTRRNVGNILREKL